jgi:lambda family phage portal protein
MSQTVSDLEARLSRVREAIDTVLSGGVSEFAHEGGDSATMLSLTELQRLEAFMVQQLAAAGRRANRFAPIRPIKIQAILLAVLLAIGAGVAEADMQTSSIVAGVGIEPADLVRPRATAKPGIVRASTPAYAGAGVTRFNADFQPPHRSGDAAVRMSWDLLVRRCRWLADNTPLLSRLVSLLVQHTVGEGLSIYSAACDHVPLADLTSNLLQHPLFRFGDESDAKFDRWAEEWADVERQKSLWEMHSLSARDLFGAGNSLWLACSKRPKSPGVSPLCYQLIEGEQLDRSRDRPPSSASLLISNGIEYAQDGEPVAYWLYDAHPYDDSAGLGMSGKSRRIPAARVAHLYLPTRPSQHFGVPLGQIAMQTAKDADWLVGQELTSAALAAGLTLLIKETNDGGDLTFDTENFGGWSNGEEYGLQHVSEVGLASGTAARVGPGEDIQVVESSRPNRNVEPFVKYLTNLAAMSGNVSFHRFTGDPTGASFATLRAMINDDRAMALPIINYMGRKTSRWVRAAHDRFAVAKGWYRAVTAGEYLAALEVYEDYDVLGPPVRHLNPTDDVTSARMRIACGLSTLRIECGLLGLSYRRVLRQLAVERDLAKALQLALDFSNGGGQSQGRTTTDAQGNGTDGTGGTDGAA